MTILIREPSEKDLPEIEKSLCERDLKYLCREILRFRDWDGCHDEWYAWDQANSGRQFKLILMPRYHLKSSILTIGKTIQDILRNPDTSILLASAVWNNARSFLSEIKEYLGGKSVLPRLYKNFVSGKWTADAVTISQREKPDKTPTIDTSGIEKVLTSQHYQIIRADDLVTRENITTKDQIQKVINHFRDLLKLLAPDGTMEIIGTRWHDADLYGHIIKELAGDKPGQFTVYQRAAIENSKVIFPKKFSAEKLAELKGQLGSYDFSCNFMNQPINPETQQFRPPVRYWTELNDKAIHTITVDLAISEKETADYTVVMDCAVNGANQLCVIEYWRKQGAHPLEILEKIFEFYSKYKARKCGIESVAYQRVIEVLLKEEQRKRNVFFEVEPIYQHKDKFTRIIALQPRYESGNLLLKQGMSELEDELSRFPVAEHDDLLDALAMQLQILTPQYLHRAKTFIPEKFR